METQLRGIGVTAKLSMVGGEERTYIRTRDDTSTGPRCPYGHLLFDLLSDPVDSSTEVRVYGPDFGCQANILLFAKFARFAKFPTAKLYEAGKGVSKRVSWPRSEATTTTHLA